MFPLIHHLTRSRDEASRLIDIGGTVCTDGVEMQGEKMKVDVPKSRNPSPHPLLLLLLLLL